MIARTREEDAPTMLQAVFGDDEHTAFDGPYVRLMKTRKWLYLTAFFATILTLGLYSASEAWKLMPFLLVPEFFLKQICWGALLYLNLQYMALLVQLVSTYDIVLGERLRFKRQEEIDASRKQIADASLEIEKHFLDHAKSHRPGKSDQERRALEITLEASRANLGFATERMESLIQNDPAQRMGYAKIERLIDGMRLGPPIIVGFIAFIRLGGAGLF